MATNQEARQASVRAVTGTAYVYDDDWLALFRAAGITTGGFNDRLLAYLNSRMGSSYANVNDAMLAFAVTQGFTSWSAMGTFDASGTPAAPVNIFAPSISGVNYYTGTTLTADRGLWSGSPASAYTYQWKRDGSNISSATNSTYVLVSADEGKTITVAVTATNTEGNATATSAGIVASALPAAPVNTVAPSISGSAIVGSTLTAADGTWTGTPTPTFTYAWKKDGVANGSTASTYVPVTGDIGSVIAVTVTGTNASGPASATSAATAAVTALPVANIFVMAGQSNAMSAGSSGTPDHYGTLDTGIVMWNGSSFTTYDPAAGDGDGGPNWGPEAGFAYAWRQANPTTTMYWVKQAYSATSLFNNDPTKNWNVASTAVGTEYPALRTKGQAARAALISAGFNPVFQTMLWMQGETDADAGLAQAQAYQQNLTDLVTALRSDFSASSMGLLVGRIGPNFTYGSTVRATELDVGSFITPSGVVSTDAFGTVDGVHYNPAGITLLGTYLYQVYTGTYDSSPTDIAVTWGGGFTSGVVPASTSVGAVVGTLASTNAVCGGAVTYSIVSGTVASVSGTNLSLASSVVNGSTYNFTLRVTNTMGTHYDKAFTITGSAAVVSTTTLNPADKADATITLSNGNLTVTGGDSNFKSVRAVGSASTGKKFFSVISDLLPGYLMVGFSQSTFSLTATVGFTATSAAYWMNDTTYANSADVGGGIGNGAGNGTVWDIAVDIDAKKMWVRKNGGNWGNNGAWNPATGVGGSDISTLTGAIYPTVGFFTESTQATCNFGATSYTYAAPSGFGNWS
jgi:hypothetical protein